MLWIWSYFIIGIIFIVILDKVDDADDPGVIILGMLWPITLIAILYMMIEELAKYINEKKNKQIKIVIL